VAVLVRVRLTAGSRDDDDNGLGDADWVASL
jgi:hypothetical protein